MYVDSRVRSISKELHVSLSIVSTHMQVGCGSATPLHYLAINGYMDLYLFMLR